MPLRRIPSCRTLDEQIKQASARVAARHGAVLRRMFAACKQGHSFELLFLKRNGSHGKHDCHIPLEELFHFFLDNFI
jgi:hypothetical protein